MHNRDADDDDDDGEVADHGAAVVLRSFYLSHPARQTTMVLLRQLGGKMGFNDSLFCVQVHTTECTSGVRGSNLVLPMVFLRKINYWYRPDLGTLKRIETRERKIEKERERDRERVSLFRHNAL